MTNLKLGVLPWTQGATMQEQIAAAREVERLGYDGVWTWDHLHAIFGDPMQPIFEGWTLLSAFAMATKRVTLGLLVGANTFRNPGVTAKMAATLDHISEGRAILGIGGAWFEFEHTAHGIDFGSGFGQRLDWLDEAVAACRVLLDGGTVTSEPGAHYAFHELRQLPVPVQQHLPIMIGGSGEKKTLRTIAKYADMWNGMGPAGGDASQDRGAPAALRRGRPRHLGDRVHAGRQARHPRLAGRGRAVLAGEHGAQQDAHGQRRRRRRPSGTARRSRSRSGWHRTSRWASTTCSLEMPAPFDQETLERLMTEVKPLVERG